MFSGDHIFVGRMEHSCVAAMSTSTRLQTLICFTALVYFIAHTFVFRAKLTDPGDNQPTGTGNVDKITLSLAVNPSLVSKKTAKR